MSKSFKFAVIGAGGIAGAHVHNIKKVEGVEVVAAADINEAGLKKFGETHGIKKLYTDYKEMLAKEKDIDGVGVCTPNGLHAENAIAALKAGKHVIVEKPMAMNAAECKKMIEAAKKADRHLVTGFQFRFDPKTQVIRRQIEEGAFGKICYVRCQALRRRGIPNWGVFGRKDLQGGGPMIDIGVHVLEMAHYMIGSPRPVAATGNTFTYIGDKPSNVASMWPNWDHKTYTVEDLAVGMVRFDSGAMLTIEAMFAGHIEKDVWTVQIMGEKGGASWDPIQVFKDQDGYMMNQTPSFVGTWDNFEKKMRHFVEVCRDGKTSISTGDHGLMVQQMLDGVYKSAEMKKEVEIK
ncbi:MAG TPA: Gfo/Idh/MocA family oxidoreductase [Planctomycetota bacterium]|nr:Gfo/Idh/MocA family oxidoreductase [Planctomycetota bacterium]